MPTPSTAPTPNRPRAIQIAQQLVVAQAIVSLICGFNPFMVFAYSFGMPLMTLLALVTGNLEAAFLGTLVIALTGGIGYAAVLHSWLGRADRRARPAVLVGAGVPLAFVAATPLSLGWEWIEIPIVAATPSLVLQSILLVLVFGSEGREWFERGRSGPVAPEP